MRLSKKKTAKALREEKDMADMTAMEQFNPDHMLKFIVNGKGEEMFFMNMAYKNKEIKIM